MVQYLKPHCCLHLIYHSPFVKTTLQLRHLTRPEQQFHGPFYNSLWLCMYVALRPMFTENILLNIYLKQKERHPNLIKVEKIVRSTDALCPAKSEMYLTWVPRKSTPKWQHDLATLFQLWSNIKIRTLSVQYICKAAEISPKYAKTNLNLIVLEAILYLYDLLNCGGSI